jgi:hypothetical protein
MTTRSATAKSTLPSTVRYVKNGMQGCWWKVAKERRQIHAGWKGISGHLLMSRELPAIKVAIQNIYGGKTGATQDFNALCDLIVEPSQHIWITFEDGFMWWCTAQDKVTANPKGESSDSGHFWIDCDRPWTNRTLEGKLLAKRDLPGIVTKTAGFKGTVCKPDADEMVIRIIEGKADVDVDTARKARITYEGTIENLIVKLSPGDFEQLIDLILNRSGWVRRSIVGKVTEGVDIEADNPVSNETAFVQVKSAATQKEFDDYLQRYSERRTVYSRMIFAVHTLKGEITVPNERSDLHLWSRVILSKLAVRLGLGEWLEGKIC